MGQKQTSSRAATVDVGDPLHVQHTAQLKLDSRKGIVLQIPELDAYLRKVFIIRALYFFVSLFMMPTNFVMCGTGKSGKF